MNDCQYKLSILICNGSDESEKTICELSFSEGESLSIDKLEQVVLPGIFSILQSVSDDYFSSLSEQRATEFAALHGGDVVINEKRYRVDGELGRFTFQTHRVERNGKIIYNSEGDLFDVLKGKEWYKTENFKELALIYGATEASYRKAAKLLNRVRHQPDSEGTPDRTLGHTVEIEGQKLVDYQEKKAAVILEKNGFDGSGYPVNQDSTLPESMLVSASTDVDEEQTEAIKKAIDSCQVALEWRTEMAENPVDYEDPDQTINIDIDDVCVKKQKEERPKNQPEETESGRKYVHDTVVHIEKKETKDDDQSTRSVYILVGASVVAALRILLAFLLHNDVLTYRLQFFVDGQKTLHAAIIRMFSWRDNSRLIWVQFVILQNSN